MFLYREITRPILSICLLLLSLPATVAHAQGGGDSPPNILLIIADDLGIDALSIYGISEAAAETPNLVELAANGIVFDQFWSQPGCTPTRAEILTGRHGFRTGVLRQVGGQTDGPRVQSPPVPDGSPAEGRNAPTQVEIGGSAPVVQSWGLRSEEFTLPSALKARSGTPYATAAFGKWHLADNRNGWLSHPNTVGFDHFSGPMGGFPASYFAWRENTNGVYTNAFGYAPSSKVDAALGWITANSEAPWFAWVAFNLPHRPLHVPSEELVNTPELKELDRESDPDADPRPRFRAMIEALDTEIGRLLTGIGDSTLENTYVIFLGDNGSEPDVISQPYRPGGAKNTLYQGGIHTPLIISGPGVAKGEVSSGLAKAIDLFGTVLEMAAMNIDEVIPGGTVIDAVSLVPYLDDPGLPTLREFNYADYLPFTAEVNQYDYTIRNQRFKLIVMQAGSELYDLAEDPHERNNLLNTNSAYNSWLDPDTQNELAELSAAASRLRSRVPETADPTPEVDP